jgi:hypothetical protein
MGGCLPVSVTMLGVFCSFAIPRFTRLENHARASAVNSTPTSVTYSKTDAPAPALCAVTYHPSPTASREATITDLKTSGC